MYNTNTKVKEGYVSADLQARTESEQRHRHRGGEGEKGGGGRLTDSDCSYDWRHDDGERHPTGDHQVPLVVGNIFAFVAVVDLKDTVRLQLNESSVRDALCTFSTK